MPEAQRDLVTIAREAVRATVADGRTPSVPERLGRRAPVFVTLRCSDGSLRGCIGSLAAVEADVTLETARNAALAATRDPRFRPLTPAEVDGLSVEVSVLGPEEPVGSEGELDPARFGVVVRDAAGRQGVLLPAVPGVADARQQVRIAREKAGIPDGASVKLFRFAVEKHR